MLHHPRKVHWPEPAFYSIHPCRLVLFGPTHDEQKLLQIFKPLKQRVVGLGEGQNIPLEHGLPGVWPIMKSLHGLPMRLHRRHPAIQKGQERTSRECDQILLLLLFLLNSMSLYLCLFLSCSDHCIQTHRVPTATSAKERTFA